MESSIYLRGTDTSEKGTPRALAGEVIRFGGFLKGHGFSLFQSSVHDALRGLSETDISNKEDFFAVLRATLVKSDLEWARFTTLFEEFWDRSKQKIRDVKSLSRRREIEEPESDLKEVPDVQLDHSADIKKDSTEKKWLEGVAYSPVSIVEKKDFARFDAGDIQVAQLALKKMVKPFKIQVSRRKKRSRKAGETDFCRIMKKSLKTEGLPLELYYKGKKKRLKRLVILADVSGSMDRYARFVMPFILGLRGVGSRAEVFAFSTSLTSLTFFVRHMTMEKALEHIASEVPGWSGGTRIGYSLHQFNRDYGRQLNSRRTVIVILSDGWDLGGKELLRREMAELSRKAYSVMWLNPLAGEPGYRPVCHGMRIALPYVDYFLPAGSLQDLKRVGRVLSKVLTHQHADPFPSREAVENPLSRELSSFCP